MNEELKPCPFCGCNAAIVASKDLTGYQWFWAKCSHIIDPHQGPRHDTEAEAIAAWNTRADGWQPIETAPKDALGVLLWWPHWWALPHPGYYKDNQWHSDKAIVPWYEGNKNKDPGPTHWMHLPSPPEQDE